eukprot:1156061-Pelagomonas_calceolata.AAC.12
MHGSMQQPADFGPQMSTRPKIKSWVKLPRGLREVEAVPSCTHEFGHCCLQVGLGLTLDTFGGSQWEALSLIQAADQFMNGKRKSFLLSFTQPSPPLCSFTQTELASLIVFLFEMFHAKPVSRHCKCAVLLTQCVPAVAALHLPPP